MVVHTTIRKNITNSNLYVPSSNWFFYTEDEILEKVWVEASRPLPDECKNVVSDSWSDASNF